MALQGSALLREGIRRQDGHTFWKRRILPSTRSGSPRQCLRWFTREEVRGTELPYGFNDIVADFFRKALSPELPSCLTCRPLPHTDSGFTPGEGLCDTAGSHVVTRVHGA